jgi:hypothetical protein
MKTGHDLMGLMKFVGRDEWKLHFEEVLGEHFGPAGQQFDLDFDAIGKALDDQWAMILWGCAFEDFLTRSVGPDHSNLVDVYLKRRGWREGAQAKAYMKALRASVMSLYEVSEIVAGKSFLARDLIRGGEPIQVTEATATKMLKQWDQIAARIVPRGDARILAGGVLPFSPDASTKLLGGIGKVTKKRRSRAKPLLDDETLRAAAPLFTSVWLFDVLPKAMGQTQPVLHNSDGEEVVFHEVRFPLAVGVTPNDVGVRLDAVPVLHQENAHFWNWLGDLPTKRPLAATTSNAVGWSVTLESGAPVLGNVELKGRFLTLSVNSAARAARGRALLEGALGELVRAPLTEIQTVEQMRASRQGQEDPAASDLPPEIATRIVHDMLDKQYRATLDEPVGMLGNISPRLAIGTQKGKQKVANWLKYLENRSASQRDPKDPMATYDFGWIWRELGIEDLRR